MWDSGDSYTNTAFDPTGAQPSPSNPLGNDGLSSSDEELAGGPGWATDLTYMFNSTPTLTYDFAYNCATVDASIVAPCSNTVRSIVDQVAEVKSIIKKGSQYGTFYQQNSLFAFWIGINDAHITANNGNILDKDIDGIMEKTSDRYMEELTTLYGFGVRNFMILNVPRE
jgi:hypothetical protein